MWIALAAPLCDGDPMPVYAQGWVPSAAGHAWIGRPLGGDWT